MMSCGPNLAPAGSTTFPEFPPECPKPRGLSLYSLGGGKALISFNGAPQSPGTIYTVNDKTSNPRNNLPTEINGSGLSCGRVIFPKRYNAKAPKIAIQIARNTSRSSKCNCNTRSALDKNLNAKASSKNPKNTFTVLSQPPDFGSEFNQPGNIANNMKGKAKANENPNIPIIGPITPFEAASNNNVPTIGPVHENETIASAKAMNKIPTIPPRSACLSTLFAQEFGSMISKAPKNEAAKITNNRKKIKLNQTFVASEFNASAPKTHETIKPRNT